MTLDLGPEVAAGLAALASAEGLSVEAYLEELVRREFAALGVHATESQGSGMVWEDGMFIYGAGSPLPADFLDNALRRSREERLKRLRGSES